MSVPRLYPGVWPQNVSRLAKYAVRFIDNEWRVTVLYEAGAGLRYLAVEGAGEGVAAQVNAVKTAVGDQPGGPFYVNEYRHVIVPVRATGGGVSGSDYYFAGRMLDDLRFEFEGQPLSTRPVGREGQPLAAGEKWIGPRPGIPYVLAAGAGDIYFESPALTEDDPPRVRANVIRKVQLSRVVGDRAAAMRNVKMVASLRGHQGGRFYVNEHGAAFTPVDGGDGNGLDYLYAGQIDRAAWFPEPVLVGMAP